MTTQPTNFNPLLIGVGAFLLSLLVAQSVFIVQQTEQALVLQFGELKRVEQTPGLKFKIPFIQNTLIYDNRVLEIEADEQKNVFLADQKRLDVSAYARYRITDPLKFYQTVSTEAGLRSRLGAIINSAMRRVLGGVTQADVLSEKRTAIMERIQNEVAQNAEDLGITVVDVRISRADFPEEISQAIFNQMRSEREREAREARAQGAEQAQQIRSRAERERTVLIAEAQREADITKGQGDAEAIKIYAVAAARDPEFYRFYRSLTAYREAFAAGSDSTLVLNPDSEFFKYFENILKD